MSALDRLVCWALPAVPKSMLWLVAQRYVAGADLSSAIRRVEEFGREGFGTILDLLGEGMGDAESARAAAAEYTRAMDRLADVDPRCTISVKPTHLGLLVDEDLCAELLAELCERARAGSRRVRLEMEDAPTIDGTLRVFRRTRADHPNLGCVLQSRLFRTADDVEQLLDEVPGLDVRLVKGIYLEPPEIAWTENRDITDSYVRLAARLVEGGAFVGFATHDTEVTEACAALVARHELDRGDARERRYEFQLLMGVRARLAAALKDDGHPVRIYVPYGDDWHAYSMRRLTRNPEIARHVLKALVLRR